MDNRVVVFVIMQGILLKKEEINKKIRKKYGTITISSAVKRS